ncbi:MAG TPA: M13 family metallopeptidase [Gemmatimonadales bacterium]
MRAIALVVSMLALAPLSALSAQSSASIKAVDSARFDTSCAPCRDFFQYANGGWAKRTEIPAQYISFGVGREVQDRTEALLRKILEDAAREAPRSTDSTTRLVGTFYATCMDSTRAAREAAAPLRPQLRLIAGVHTRSDLSAVLGELQHQGINVGLPVFAYPDLASSDTLRLNFYQGSYGLPDRDYYLRPDSAFAAARTDYRAHVLRMFQLLGEKPEAARQDAERVWRVESALARAALPSEKATKFPELHHPVARSALDSAAPHLDWNRFLAAVGVPQPTLINVAIPSELAAVDSLVGAAPLEDWRAYLRWRVASFAAPFLGSRFEAEHLAHHRIVGGSTELKPRWQRCLDAADEHIGEALGQAYVRVAFPPESKARMLDLVANLRTALRTRLQRVPWMSDTTRAAALAKLDAMTSKIGYPDRWRDYSRLAVRPGAFLPNIIAAQRFEVDRQNKRIDGLVDRSEWNLSPPTYNAYHNPPNNEIVFPAGILQPPLFDPAADDAVNYGAVGFIIGHELLHAFDDNGRHFDAHGNLREWWTPADSAGFEQRAGVVVAQYSNYVAVDTMRINGRLTLGENLADIGGLMVAYDAWRLSLRGKPEPPPIDGFTAEQRFFLAFANFWREKTRLEAQRQYAVSNPHSPERWRVNGVVGHLPAFARAFGCKQGDPMVRPDSERLQLW